MTDNTTRRRFLRYTGATTAASMVGLTGYAKQETTTEGDGQETTQETDYPTQRIEYIVPFSEGGGTDTYARQIMPQVSDILGVPIQINNVPGSASLRGAGQMVRAEPDGYTFGGFNPPSTPVSYMLNPPEGWDLRSLRGVCAYARTPYVVYVNPDQDYSDLSGVIEAYNNGDLTNLGGQQRGGIVHVIAQIMKNNEEYGMGWENYVGYDGGGPLVQAVASGEVPVGITTDASGLSAAEDDRVRVVAVLSSDGSNVFPDVDSVVDQGYPNIDYVGQLTRCMWMPGETPDPPVRVMTNAVEEALQTDAVQQWSEETGNIIEYHPPEYADDVLQTAFEEIPDKVDLESMREST